MQKELNKIAKDTNIFLKKFIKKQKKSELIIPMQYGLFSGGKKIRSKILIDVGSLFKINYKSLNFFYNKLSTIYRYNHGEVQLSFLWDGTSHEEYYRNRWKSFFKRETNRMSQNLSFLKSVLYLTIFSNNVDEKAEIQYRVSTFLRKDFNIQVFKRKGVVLHTK